jgi:hypothetical protein
MILNVFYLKEAAAQVGCRRLQCPDKVGTLNYPTKYKKKEYGG